MFFTTTPSSQHNIKQILSEDTMSARIDCLTKFFSQAVLREQHAAFPLILANIFGYDHTQGWSQHQMFCERTVYGSLDVFRCHFTGWTPGTLWTRRYEIVFGRHDR